MQPGTPSHAEPRSDGPEPRSIAPPPILNSKLEFGILAADAPGGDVAGEGDGLPATLGKEWSSRGLSSVTYTAHRIDWGRLAADMVKRGEGRTRPASPRPGLDYAACVCARAITTPSTAASISVRIVT
jgi:hypothetical protein